MLPSIVVNGLFIIDAPICTTWFNMVNSSQYTSISSKQCTYTFNFHFEFLSDQEMQTERTLRVNRIFFSISGTEYFSQHHNYNARYILVSSFT